MANRRTIYRNHIPGFKFNHSRFQHSLFNLSETFKLISLSTPTLCTSAQLFEGTYKGRIKPVLATELSNFKTLVTYFIKRLTARGYSINNLMPLLLQAAMTLDSTVSTTTKPKHEDSTLFIHWRHHPKGLQRHDIRSIYNTTLQPHLDFANTTIAISRTKNLKDILSRTALSMPDGYSIQQKIEDRKKENGTI